MWSSINTQYSGISGPTIPQRCVPRSKHYNMAPPNPTGFDMRTFVKASTSPEWRARDPWSKHEAWRYSGPFTRFNRFKKAFPGLGIATVAFAGYLVYEAIFLKESHHGEGHGSEHH